MTDLFFSYSSHDREQVQPVRDTFAALGFDVFWDQVLPVNVDWDTWIRRHLTEAKCVVVFWSSHSIISDNVRHEAAVAKQHGKLLSVLLEPLDAEQLPMGLYSAQAAKLLAWNGDESYPEWIKLREAVEERLTAPWVRRLLDVKDAELLAERSGREAAERRNKLLREQIARAVEQQQEIITERDEAISSAAKDKQKLEATIDNLKAQITNGPIQTASTAAPASRSRLNIGKPPSKSPPYTTERISPARVISALGTSARKGRAPSDDIAAAVKVIFVVLVATAVFIGLLFLIGYLVTSAI